MNVGTQLGCSFSRSTERNETGFMTALTLHYSRNKRAPSGGLHSEKKKRGSKAVNICTGGISLHTGSLKSDYHTLSGTSWWDNA